MQNIANMRNKRLREREFPVYYCEWMTRVELFRVGIALPEPFDSRLHVMFQEALRPVAPIVDIGATYPEDVGARPLLRYVNGKLIEYVSPFDSEGGSPELERRSFAIADKPSQSGRPDPLPKSETRRGKTRHSLELWQSVRADVLDLVWNTLGIGTYHWLRRETREAFGISVLETNATLAGRYGRIETGWVYGHSDGHVECDVSIVLNTDLSPTLKYVALAHELAHYVLHFPIILAGGIIEQAAWEHPACEHTFRKYLAEKFNELRDLEDHANRFAGNFLVTPRFDYGSITKEGILFEGGQTVTGDEMMWRFFQNHFPETKGQKFSWNNLGSLRSRFRDEAASVRDMNILDADTLYKTMLRAVLERDSEVAADQNRQVELATNAVLSDLSAIVHTAIGLNRSSSDRDDSAPALIDGATLVRQILPAKQSSSSQDRRLPLIPVKRGKSANWQSVLHTSAQPRDIEWWREQYSTHQVVVYPTRTKPSDNLFTLDSA